MLFLNAGKMNRELLYRYYFLKGKLNLYSNRIDEAIDYFKKASDIDPFNPEAKLWYIFSKFLKAYLRKDTSFFTRYLTNIYLELDEIKFLFKENFIIGEIHHWIGIICAFLNDYQESLRFLNKAYFYYKKAKKEKIIDERIKYCSDLTGIIWNYKICPNWWQWWWSSPKQLKRCRKRSVFLIFSSIIFLVTIFPLLYIISYILNYINNIYHLYNFYFNQSFFYFILKYFDKCWHLVIFSILVFIFILISPVIYRFRLKEIEIEYKFTPPIDISSFTSMLNAISKKLLPDEKTTQISV